MWRSRRLAGRPWTETVPLLVQAAHGLEYLASRGIVHRDLSPDNILVIERGGERFVKLLDFGVAKLFDRTAGLDSLTATGFFLGKVAYGSPEQLGALGHNATLDWRSDVYSLGIIFYQVLSGRRPFEGKAPVEYIAAHLNTEPAPVAAPPEMPPLPMDLVRLVSQMLAKHREDRPASWREIVDRLVAVLRDAGQPVRTPTEPLPAPLLAAPPTTRTSLVSHGDGSAPGPPPPRRALVWAGAVAGLLLVGGVAWEVLRSASAPPVTAPAPVPAVPRESLLHFRRRRPRRLLAGCKSTPRPGPASSRSSTSPRGARCRSPTAPKRRASSSRSRRARTASSSPPRRPDKRAWKRPSRWRRAGRPSSRRRSSRTRRSSTRSGETIAGSLPTMRFPKTTATALLAAASLASLPARAQIDSALLSKLSFNLTNPGGKSLAMGGAFTAIADDTTAALANPAGLGLLSSIEFGISAKGIDETIGLVTAQSTATGSLTAPWSPVHASQSPFTSSSVGVEYAGLVVPVSRRVVLALSYAENLRFEGEAGGDGYSYIDFRDNRTGGVTRRDILYEYREFGAVELRNRLLALSVGYRLTERIRLGAGLTLNKTTFELNGDAEGPHRIVNTTYVSAVAVDTRTLLMQVDDFGGTKPGFILGLHADLDARGMATVGASYRSGAKTNGTLVIGGDVPAALAGQTSRPFTFSVPQDASVGVAVRPVPGMTIAAEAQWIDYGSIFDRQLPDPVLQRLRRPAPGLSGGGRARSGVAVEERLGAARRPGVRRGRGRDARRLPRRLPPRAGARRDGRARLPATRRGRRSP